MGWIWKEVPLYFGLCFNPTINLKYIKNKKITAFICEDILFCQSSVKSGRLLVWDASSLIIFCCQLQYLSNSTVTHLCSWPIVQLLPFLKCISDFSLFCYACHSTSPSPSSLHRFNSLTSLLDWEPSAATSSACAPGGIYPSVAAAAQGRHPSNTKSPCSLTPKFCQDLIFTLFRFTPFLSRLAYQCQLNMCMHLVVLSHCTFQAILFVIKAIKRWGRNENNH